MTSKSHLLIAVLTFVGCFILLALRPVPAEALHNVKSITGKVVKVSEDDQTGDVSIELKNDDRIYYFNRGITTEVDFKILRNNLLYRQATLNIAGHLKKLDASDQSIPVARVTVSGQIFWQQPTAKFVAN